MKTTLTILAIALALLLGWIRFSPTDVDDWHLDPGDTEDPGQSGLRLIGREAPRFPGDPDTVLTEVMSIAKAEPRTRVLDGSVEEGMITFVHRTRLMGYRDYTTLKAVAEGDMTKLSLAARSRYSFAHDWGTNSARMDRWLAELQDRLQR